MQRDGMVGRQVRQRRSWSTAVLVIAIVAGATVRVSASPLHSAGSSNTVNPTPTPNARPRSTQKHVQKPKPKPAPKPAPNLSPGDSGAAVLALQRRLSVLGYWLGKPDGYFGDSTEQAVFALQKAAGLSRDGVVGPLTAGALAKGVLPRPRPVKGYVIEVDLEDDLVMFVTNGKLDYVLNTSTGGGYDYTEHYDHSKQKITTVRKHGKVKKVVKNVTIVQTVSYVATTPVGRFEIYTEVNGIVTDQLGQLWRPKFFDGGFAIHGDSFVPPEPVSHGCVRVSDEAIDWIWANNLAPIGTPVWVY